MSVSGAARSAAVGETLIHAAGAGQGNPGVGLRAVTEAEAGRSTHTGDMTEHQNPPHHEPQPASYRRLRRSRDNRMVAGVCAGVADYLRIDPVVVRIGAVVLALITWGVALLAYVAGWLLMPEAD
jgi:phage shock protein C